MDRSSDSSAEDHAEILPFSPGCQLYGSLPIEMIPQDVEVVLAKQDCPSSELGLWGRKFNPFVRYSLFTAWREALCQEGCRGMAIEYGLRSVFSQTEMGEIKGLIIHSML